MRKLISICLVTFLAISCSSSDPDPNIAGTVYDGSINLTVSNTNAEDLLSASNPNAYKKNKIKVLYLLNGKLTEQFDGKLDSPSFFSIYEQDGQNVIRVFLNSSAEEKYPETYIQWDENHTDVIKVEYNRTSNSVFKKTVWINDQLITKVDPYVKIVK
ncbi:hypothetical protein [Flavobacterium johnsoniae]|jgi:hypothetical protein|uniref:Lipoprotein n=1 Tax=Flavobacterium johnsoniae TaxID=986 RepID=A0A1M5G212_FLAJO|nr:hypothetical protein [Flavobacterium johnsoniae]SHF97491.1 hypothetical protein SAMN05444388_101208 [Flavobacterium johnsoniae]